VLLPRRLLRLTSEALAANGVPHASMVALATTAAHTGLASRQAELQRFLHDPECTCLLLLMSNSSGAAGLNLTAASTAFILEPAPNPGLEAQAAARIYRLGQSKATRLVGGAAVHAASRAAVCCAGRRSAPMLCC
jgi:E3 ubiquitin-protein ligase SHPRH